VNAELSWLSKDRTDCALMTGNKFWGRRLTKYQIPSLGSTLQKKGVSATLDETVILGPGLDNSSASSNVFDT
jgi:hypothetical protein